MIAENEGTLGYIHMFSVGDWTECGTWPSMINSMSTFPVPVITAEGYYIAAAEEEGYLLLLMPGGR